MSNKEKDEILGNLPNYARDSQSMEQVWRDLAKVTDNADRYDSALANLQGLFQRKEDWERSLPAAQVERLMAAGMSRAQALATLQSTGESVPSQVTTAGNVEQAENERRALIGQLIAESVQLFESIVNTGVNLGLAIPTIRTQVQQAKIAKQQANQLEIQTSITRMNYDALTDVANFMQSFQNYQQRTGQPIPTDLNATLQAMQAVAYDDMPDVYSMSHDRLQKAMENPMFYPALKKAHEEFSKGNYELSMDLRRNLADLRVTNLRPEVMFSEISKNWSDVFVEQSELPEVLENIRSSTNLNSSQAFMWKQKGRVEKADADYWTREGAHNRETYLSNLTSAQIYESKLMELGVQYNTAFNETACTELWNELQIAKNLGPDYFNSRVHELMQNTEYRNAVLESSLYALQKRKENADSWYGSMFEWFSSYGVLGQAIDAAESLAGSAIMGGAIYEGHTMHGKGVPKP